MLKLSLLFLNPYVGTGNLPRSGCLRGVHRKHPGIATSERLHPARRELKTTNLELVAEQNVLERYADPDRKALLPFISDQKYNDAIKEIFKLAGVTRNVVVRNSLTGEQEIRPINEIASSHMARRTFVGNIYKKFKDQSLVSELSGHAPNSAAFARYREVDEEMKREMVSAID